MRPASNRVALGVLALTLVAAGIPASGQDRPQSILPPGFGTPAPTPAPQPRPVPPPAQPAARSPQNPLGLSILPGATPAAVPTPLATPTPLASPTPTATPTPTPGYDLPGDYELPAFARHSLRRVGIAGIGAQGLAPDAFGDADGRYLETLMRRLSTPIASRWLEIALRRALASPVDTPHVLNGADFAAERAWLLLRMGEPVVARGVVDDVDRANYTLKMLQVAQQVALANGDAGGLCPLLAVSQRFGLGDAGWALTTAMCAGLAGEPQKANALMRVDRRHHIAPDIDLLLAEKVLGAGARGQRAVSIDWLGVDQLNAWRYGLAATTATDIPDTLLASVHSQVRDWRALSPVLDAPARAVFADQAAAEGILSNAAMVDLYGEIDMGDDQGGAEDAVARDLRTAYDGPTRDARMGALRTLWKGGKGAQGGFAREVLTARAATGIVPADKVADTDRLIASMLTAGLDRSAMGWFAHVDRGSDGWAMLALADPDPAAPIGYGDLRGYVSAAGDAGQWKARMLLAGLAGLGRMSDGDAERAARALNVRIGAENDWTRALERAAAADQPATVLLLAATGMQAPGWHAISPEALYHVVAALDAVGLNGTARMIAAEAIARA